MANHSGRTVAKLCFPAGYWGRVTSGVKLVTYDKPFQ